MQKTMHVSSRSKGFTLIELLIVIAIIGILVGIGVPTYKSVRKANEGAAVATLSSIRVARAKYVIDHKDNTARLDSCSKRAILISGSTLTGLMTAAMSL